MNPAFLPWRQDQVSAPTQMEREWLSDGGASWLADGFARLGDYLAKHLAFARFLEGR